ncbi:MAG: sigma-70 family RNA polymerase sigma factor [Isosphaeraceae bacterium]|nr:sigma-70 family RNA polymerase sigma factor [Isosphaeraceae bacterium]
MQRGISSGALRDLGRIFVGDPRSSGGEGRVLERSLERSEGAGLAMIVERHGPMVLRVCRQWLRDANDVEDAFQATFLVLVRRSRELSRHDELGGWLHAVAVRVAKRARATSGRRMLDEAEAIEATAPDRSNEPWLDFVESELGATLHEEIARLPETYRRAVVLCYLEDLTHEEAARSLGWPLGTVKGRLARARELLRSRLSRRGLAPTTSAALLAGLTSRSADAAVSARLLASTTNAALGLVAGASASISTSTAVSPAALAWMKGAMDTMMIGQLKSLWATIGLVGLVAAGSTAVMLGDDPRPNTGSSPVTAPAEGIASSRGGSLGTARGATSPANPALGTMPGGPQPGPGMSPATALPGRGGRGGMMGGGSTSTTARDPLVPTGVGSPGPLVPSDSQDPLPAATGSTGAISSAVDALTTRPASSPESAPANSRASDKRPTPSRDLDDAQAEILGREAALAAEAIKTYQALQARGAVSQNDPSFETWTERVFTTRMALSKTHEERRAILDEERALLQEYRKRWQQQREKGAISTNEALEKEYALLERELRMLETANRHLADRPADSRPEAALTQPVSALRPNLAPLDVVELGDAPRRRPRIASRVPNPADAPMEAEIRAALEKPITIQADQMPLKDFVKLFKELTAARRLPIHLDAEALENAGISTDQPLTIDLEEVPARTILQLAVSSLGLEYHIADGVVIITSEDRVENAPAIAPTPRPLSSSSR